MPITLRPIKRVTRDVTLRVAYGAALRFQFEAWRRWKAVYHSRGGEGARGTGGEGIDVCVWL